MKFFLKDLFILIGKAGIQRGGETERKIFYLMIHSPSDCKRLVLSQSKARSQELFWVSHVGAGSQELGPSSTAFPGHKQGAGCEVGWLGLEPAIIWNPGVCKMRTLTTRLSHPVWEWKIWGTVFSWIGMCFYHCTTGWEECDAELL